MFFDPGKHFLPCLIFVGKAWSLSIVCSTIRCTTHSDFHNAPNIGLGWRCLLESTLKFFKAKIFITLVSDLNVLNTYTAVIYVATLLATEPTAPLWRFLMSFCSHKDCSAHIERTRVRWNTRMTLLHNGFPIFSDTQKYSYTNQMVQLKR